MLAGNGFIGTSLSATKVHIIERVREEMRWGFDAVQKVTASTPWKPLLGKVGSTILTSVAAYHFETQGQSDGATPVMDDDDLSLDAPEIEIFKPEVRASRVAREDIWKHGATAKCLGFGREWQRPMAHADACRARTMRHSGHPSRSHWERVERRGGQRSC